MKEQNPVSKPDHDIVDLWEEGLLRRYPEDQQKKEEEFRNYDAPARDTVKEFYRLNHSDKIVYSEKYLPEVIHF